MSDFFDQAVQWVVPPASVIDRAADATAALLSQGAAPDPPKNTPVRRWATVTALNAGPPPTVNITLGATGVVGVRYLISYMPAVGDVVVVDTINGDPLVIGRRANNWTADALTFNGSMFITGSLSVGSTGQSIMTGDGWFRSYGQTGWYSQTYSSGIFCTAADGYVRAYPDSYGGGAFYSSTEVRAGSSAMGTWQNNGSYLCLYHPSTNPGRTGNVGNFTLLSDSQRTYLNGELSSAMRSGGAGDAIIVGQAFGTVGAGDIHFPTAAVGIVGVVLNLSNSGSVQVGYPTSSITFKTDVTPYSGGADNPVWKFQPVKFLWDEDTTTNGKEANLLKPEGQVGLIAEHVNEHAPDAVQVMVPPGTGIDEMQAVQQSEDLGGYDIVALDNNVLIGYLVDAVQYLASRIAALEGAPV